MRKREFLWIGIAMAAIALSVVPAAAKKKDLYPEYDLMTRVVDRILSDYVDPVDPEKLFQGAFGGMVSSLDPYSQFLPAEAKEELDIETSGQYGGLGIEITLDRAGYLTVVTPMEDTPAFRGGVMAGDKILRIDGRNVLAIPLTRRLSEAVKMLRGKPGTEVTINVLHEDGAREDITLTREIISTRSVRATSIVDEDAGIGYVRMSQFQRGTVQELDEAVNTLKKQGMRALILDLRYNPGGLLDEAVGVADRFLAEGVIVSTGGRTRESNQKFMAQKGNTYPDFPLVVLISQRSASGSEIVAGALQDNHRAVVVGTRSYGKGSVQSIVQLPDGSALRLTTARYYTPSGRSIHRNPYDETFDKEKSEWGIEPDFPVPISRAEEAAILQKWRDEHIIRNNKDKPKTDGEDVSEEDRPMPQEKPRVQPPDRDEEEGLVPPEPEEEHKPPVDRQLEVAKTVLKAILLSRGESIKRPAATAATEAAAVE